MARWFRYASEETVELLADLASVESTKQLSNEERVRLETAYRASLPSGSIRLPRGWFEAVHKIVSDVLNGLLDGEAVILAAPANSAQLRLDRVRETVRVDYPDRYVADPQYATVLLLNTIRDDPFPYRRCPHCRRVFAVISTRRQLYCSTNCLAKEQQIKHKDKKRKYMKDYMKTKYRPRLKKKALRERRGENA
ncbi:MAG: hypothetical protein IT294_07180 [Deltaproteobacteria bacterium]|nr:hypothetical protein [Deltaproteobacteria bacterium]